MPACDRREMANGGMGIGSILSRSCVFSNAMTRGGELLQNSAGRLMKTGIVEHHQEFGRQATRPARGPVRPAKRVHKKFQNSTSKLLQATILEYDQSLVRGAGGDGSPPVAT